MSERRDFWNQKYAGAGEDYLFGTAPNRFLARSLGDLAGCTTVLSLADGEGRNSVWLAEQGFEVVATELSPVALVKAKKLAAGRGVGVKFVEADITTWPWPVAEFDAIVAVFIQFLAPAERAVVFPAMQAALRPGGVLLLHGYTPKQREFATGGPSAVENLYTPEILRAAFPGMEIVRLEEYEEVIEEGRAHAGRSALIDLVARKPGL